MTSNSTTAEGLAAAWERVLDSKESRERWERHVVAAEEAFADLAAQHGLTWAEAVELANEA